MIWTDRKSIGIANKRLHLASKFCQSRLYKVIQFLSLQLMPTVYHQPFTPSPFFLWKWWDNYYLHTKSFDVKFAWEITNHGALCTMNCCNVVFFFSEFLFCPLLLDASVINHHRPCRGIERIYLLYTLLLNWRRSGSKIHQRKWL